MVILDTNILARYFLKDTLPLFSKATQIITHNDVYIDEVVTSEFIWLMTKTYKLSRIQFIPALIEFLQIKTVINPRKNLLINATSIYLNVHNLSFVDCWAHVIAKDKSEILATFDQKLSSYHKQN